MFGCEPRRPGRRSVAAGSLTRPGNLAIAILEVAHLCFHAALLLQRSLQHTPTAPRVVGDKRSSLRERQKKRKQNEKKNPKTQGL